MLEGEREALARVVPEVALHGPVPFDEVILASAEPMFVLSTLLLVMSSAALLLAVVGVYSSMGYSVARRVPEIGVRMALGAGHGSVRWMVLRRAALLSGLGLGLVAAMVAARGISAFLFGVERMDPASFVGAAALILVVSLAAAWVPARRASAVDPMIALRGS